MSARAAGAPRRHDHEPFDELAVGWALHALEPEDEALFSIHLPTCTRCARTVAETADVMQALAADLPPAEPREDLRDRLHAAVEETAQIRRPDPSPELSEDRSADPRAAAAVPHPPGPAATGFPGYRSPAGGDRPLRPAWRRVLPSALVAAAVAAVLGLGTWSVLLATARDEAVATAAARAEVVDALLQPGKATIAPLSDGDGNRVATVVARDDRVQVVTDGLSVNDRESTVYVVWGMAEAAPVPLGTFDVVRSQMDLRTVGSAATGLDDYDGYAVSIEPGRQAPSTPTEVVANGQVTS